MKKYATYMLPIATLCLIATLAIQGIAFVVVALSSDNIGNGQPLHFFEMLHLPIFSVALPVLGMILFAACLPALQRRNPAERSNLLGDSPWFSIHRSKTEPQYKTA